MSTVHLEGTSDDAIERVAAFVDEAADRIEAQFLADLRAVLAEVAAERAGREAAEQRLAAVLAVHVETGHHYCVACGQKWPCVTARAAGPTPEAQQ